MPVSSVTLVLSQATKSLHCLITRLHLLMMIYGNVETRGDLDLENCALRCLRGPKDVRLDMECSEENK